LNKLECFTQAIRRLCILLAWNKTFIPKTDNIGDEKNQNKPPVTTLFLENDPIQRLPHPPEGSEGRVTRGNHWGVTRYHPLGVSSQPVAPLLPCRSKDTAGRCPHALNFCKKVQQHKGWARFPIAWSYPCRCLSLPSGGSIAEAQQGSDTMQMEGQLSTAGKTGGERKADREDPPRRERHPPALEFPDKDPSDYPPSRGNNGEHSLCLGASSAKKRVPTTRGGVSSKSPVVPKQYWTSKIRWCAGTSHQKKQQGPKGAVEVVHISLLGVKSYDW